MKPFQVLSAGPEDTRKIAAALAPHLQAGDVVLLAGGLGAGKTLFVSAVVSALGGSDSVTSPTFTLANTYKTAQAEILHIDTYRLESIPEFRDLGLLDYVEDSITLIEWGDAVASEFPDGLSVWIEGRDGSDDERHITIGSSDDRWASVIEELRQSRPEVLS
jgi:tRNA threonylcarbamoyladenosine biosynthesis protein TsaE